MTRKKEETFEEVLMEGRLIPDWLERARVQGLVQGLEIAARNALAQGASLDFIKKITGLDIETIIQLASSN